MGIKKDVDVVNAGEQAYISLFYHNRGGFKKPQDIYPVSVRYICLLSQFNSDGMNWNDTITRIQLIFRADHERCSSGCLSNDRVLLKKKELSYYST